MKKLLSGILVSTMLLSTLSMTAFAVENTQTPLQAIETATLASPASDFRFGGGQISSYLGSGGDVVIPDTINGQAVFRIYGFMFNTSITTVTIPDSVTEIYSHAFYGCTSLTSVTIGNSVTDIWHEAFLGCDSLTDVYYAGSLEDRRSIKISFCNDELTTATWHYNSTGTSTSTPEVTTPETPTSPVYDPWADSFVTFSEEKGLMVDSLGMDYTKSITREQIADLLVNMIEKATGETLESNTETFTDTSSESVSKASQAGIINGRGNGIFAPYDTATRQEISIMVLRAIEKMEEITGKSYIDHSLTSLVGYGDFDSTSSWAKDSVAILANNEIMTGANGNLTPLSATSIQECLVLNKNLFELV